MSEPTDNLELLDQFLEQERVAVLATQTSSGVHAAAMLYVHQQNPLRFYFYTSKDSKKLAGVNQLGDSLEASCVIGSDPNVKFSLQLDGSIAICSGLEHKEIAEQFVAKQTKRWQELTEDPDYVLLKFIPKSAKYTVYTIDSYEKFTLDV